MSRFGILDDHKLDHVPGTVLLDDGVQGAQLAQGVQGLKHGTGKHSHIVLAPQPSDDPNDPLNWPLWKKDLCLFTVGLGSLCFTAVLTPMLSPATYELSIFFDTSIASIAQLTGDMLLCVGAFGVFVSAMSRIGASDHNSFSHLSLELLALLFVRRQTRMTPSSRVGSSKASLWLHTNPWSWHFWSPTLLEFCPLSFLVAQIWGVPPYNLSAASVGYLYTGPFIGGFLGVVFMSFLSDRLARYTARKNGGVYEPEFRIYPIVLAVVTGIIGTFLFGHMIEAGKGYYLASFLHGVYGFSVNIAGAVMNPYVVDAYRDESTEILVIAMVFKNFFFFSLSYWVNAYLAEVGPARYFDVQGGIVLGIYLLSIPMYVLGKKNRSWWRRLGLLSKLHMDSR